MYLKSSCSIGYFDLKFDMMKTLSWESQEDKRAKDYDILNLSMRRETSIKSFLKEATYLSVY